MAHGQAATRPSGLARFVSEAPAPGIMQRVADDCEDLTTTRYLRHRLLLGVLGEAARRADAMARLEVELSRLDGTAPAG
jgi:hypothetical protein